MTKHEKIQEAYGELFSSFEKYIDQDGWLNWCHKKASLIKYMDVSEIDFDGIKQRPKSLQGIEKNNGWIKFEDKLITKWNDSFDIVFTNKGNIYTYDTYCKFSSINEFERITHFQQITKPQPPIY